MEVDRNTPAIVDDLDPTVGEQGDVDAGAVPRHCFVDGVVDDFIDQVMQTRRTGGSDVHTRPLADCFEAFEDRDVLRPVRVGSGHVADAFHKG